MVTEETLTKLQKISKLKKDGALSNDELLLLKKVILDTDSSVSEQEEQKALIQSIPIDEISSNNLRQNEVSKRIGADGQHKSQHTCKSGRQKTNTPPIISALAIGVLFAITIGVLIVVSQTSGQQENSSEDNAQSANTNSGTYILTPQQSLQLIRGCCEGSGGKFSPSFQDCIIVPGGREATVRKAFIGCVGERAYVRFPNGNEYHLDGEKLIRSL
jgi:hypothetical protein